MAAPIITSVTIEPDPVPAGSQATITVNAYDPDQGEFTVTGTVTDSAGTEVPFSATGRTSDPLVYEAVVDVGTLTHDTVLGNVFYWTA